MKVDSVERFKKTGYGVWHDEAGPEDLIAWFPTLEMAEDYIKQQAASDERHYLTLHATTAAFAFINDVKARIGNWLSICGEELGHEDSQQCQGK